MTFKDIMFAFFAHTRSKPLWGCPGGRQMNTFLPPSPWLPFLIVIQFQMPHPWRNDPVYRVSNKVYVTFPATLKPTAPMSKYDAIILFYLEALTNTDGWLYIYPWVSTPITIKLAEYWELKTTLLLDCRCVLEGWITAVTHRVCPLGLLHN